MHCLQVLGVPAGEEGDSLKRVAQKIRRKNALIEKLKVQVAAGAQANTEHARLQALEAVMEARLGADWQADVQRLAAKVEVDRGTLVSMEVEMIQLRDDLRSAEAAAAAEVRSGTAHVRKLRSQISKLEHNQRVVLEEHELALDDLRDELNGKLEEDEALLGLDPVRDDLDWLPDGPEAAAGPERSGGMHALLRFALVRRPDRKGWMYDPQQMVKLSEIITKFGLRTSGVADMIHAVLSLLTGESEADIKDQVQLPSYTTIRQTHQAVAHGRLLTTQAIVESSEFVNIECDEGQFARLKNFVILVTLPGFRRLLLRVSVRASQTPQRRWAQHRVCVCVCVGIGCGCLPASWLTLNPTTRRLTRLPCALLCAGSVRDGQGRA
jgi:hypothetical protein